MLYRLLKLIKVINIYILDLTIKQISYSNNIRYSIAKVRIINSMYHCKYML